MTSKAKRVTVGLLFVLLSLGPAHAARPVWQFIWMGPNDDPKQAFDGTKAWTAAGGRDRFSFDGKSLSAFLNDDPNSGMTIDISGHVKGRRVTATVRYFDADGDPEHFSGEVSKERCKSTEPCAGAERDLIWLHSGPYYIGLRREYPARK